MNFGNMSFPLDVGSLDLIGDINEMHTKFGVHPIIEGLDTDKLLTFVDFRLKFLQEEIDEGRKAFEILKSETPTRKAADDIVDACIDLIVVAIGTLDALQVDADTAWMKVHEANMKKQAGVNPNRPNPLGLPDLIKPAGWTAPSHGDNIGLLEKLLKA